MESHRTEFSDEITCLRAANPSAMTGTGTNTYVLHGSQGCVVIDPGPALPTHLRAILDCVGRAPLAAILVTHAHLDHSALCPALVASTGAPVLAFGTAESGRSPLMTRLAAEGLSGGGEGIDAGFAPNLCVADGEMLVLGGLEIEALHTPGHMGGHLTFALGDLAFSGDHVMGWASSLVSPPDGDMRAYLGSLTRLAGRRWRCMLPGHGPAITTPKVRLAELARHRQDREDEILRHLSRGPMTSFELVALIYTETPAALLGAARRNVLAHLLDLDARNLVVGTLPLGESARFRRV